MRLHSIGATPIQTTMLAAISENGLRKDQPQVRILHLHSLRESMEDAPDNISCGTMLKCWAGTCRYNANGLCAFKGIEIGKDGNCISFAIRDRNTIVDYLKKRGLTEDEIQQVLQGL